MTTEDYKRDVHDMREDCCTEIRQGNYIMASNLIDRVTNLEYLWLRHVAIGSKLERVACRACENTGQGDEMECQVCEGYGTIYK